jgi:DNA-binding PadR family transcriptional regulator
MSKPKDVVQGTLDDLLILKLLALHKLEQEGWIKAEWAPSENNRRASTTR